MLTMQGCFDVTKPLRKKLRIFLQIIQIAWTSKTEL